MRRSKLWILLLVSYLRYFAASKITKIFLFVSFGICSFMLYKEVHFEVNFIYCVRYGLKFIFSHMDTQLCHIIYWKDYFFRHWIAFILLLKVSCPYSTDLFSRLPILFHWSIFLSGGQWHSLNYYCIIRTLEIK